LEEDFNNKTNSNKIPKVVDYLVVANKIINKVDFLEAIPEIKTNNNNLEALETTTMQEVKEDYLVLEVLITLVNNNPVFLTQIINKKLHK